MRHRQTHKIVYTGCGMLVCALLAVVARAAPAFRPPAVPLVTFDPYMSIWSENNHLANHRTRYWDGRIQSLVSLVRIDGKAYRLMGNDPHTSPALHQISVAVRPTTTIYRFANHKIDLTLTFTTPRLPAKLKIMTLPVTYITWRVKSADGHAHQVQLYYSTSSAIAVNHDRQQVTWSRLHFGALTALKCGTPSQNYFNLSGDPVGLDWGYIYTVVRRNQSTACIADNSRCIHDFLTNGAIPTTDAGNMPRAVSAGQPVEAVCFNLGTVNADPVTRNVMVAYDEVYAIDYFGQYQRPYWRHVFKSPSQMFQWADGHYKSLMRQSAAFDVRVMADARRVGGNRYALIAALAYRQSLAAMGMSADTHGMPMVYTKEETSNGDIDTVDVFFPASPIFLLFDPQLESASMVPILNSANTPRWRFPWSPHDLGTYPMCVGHYNSGGENMPIEESGNMIILAGAIAKAEGNADFAAKYWPLFTRWVKYLRKNGFDPKDQLSTDDFLGPRSHNANLSVKAIEAIGAYGLLCKMRGMDTMAAQYHAIAQRWAQRWMRVDKEGNHYRAEFNLPHSWGELYNMAWDRVLGLHLFPPEVYHREIQFYLTKMTRFGLPLNYQTTNSDTDHSIYTAILARHRAHFRRIIGGLYNFLNDTPNRVPLADYYSTTTLQGFMHARPVVGAVFVKMMLDPKMWRYWASRSEKIGTHWQGLPPPPVVKQIVPTAQKSPIIWHYTIRKPPAGWYQPDFNDSGWKVGSAGFGSADPGVTPRTSWLTPDIWIRRHFNMPAGHFNDLVIYAYHDEGIEVYINGVLAGTASGYTTTYVPVRITPAGLRALHPGRNLMAVHTHQTTGGQFIDLGLAQWKIPRKKH